MSSHACLWIISKYYNHSLVINECLHFTDRQFWKDFQIFFEKKKQEDHLKSKCQGYMVHRQNTRKRRENKRVISLRGGSVYFC